MDYVIRRVRIVGRHEVSEGDLLIENGRIAATGKVGRAPGAKVISGAGLYALPGFVDIHVHGGTGLDLTCGRFDAKEKRFDASPSAYAEGFPRLMKHFARNGVTRVMLATVAAPMKDLERALVAHGRLHRGPAERPAWRAAGRRADRGHVHREARAGGRAEPGELPRARPAALRAAQPRRARPHLVRQHRPRVREAGGGPDAPPGRTRRARRRRAQRSAMPTRCCAPRANGLRVAIHFLNGPTGTLLQAVPRRQRRRGRPPQPRNLRRADLRRLARRPRLRPRRDRAQRHRPDHRRDGRHVRRRHAGHPLLHVRGARGRVRAYRANTSGSKAASRRCSAAC